MIKQEMLVMIRHDIVHHPTPHAGKNRSTSIKADLDKNPLEHILQGDLLKVMIVMIKI